MSKLTMKELQRHSYLAGVNAGYIEELYEAYLQDALSVPEEWQDYFKTLASSSAAEFSHQALREQFKKMAKSPIVATVSAESVATLKQLSVDRMI